MEAEICRLGPDHLPAAGRLLDEAVGTGFWDAGDADAELSLVAVTGPRVSGVLLARLAPRAELPEVDEASVDTLGGPADRVLHVREIAVAPEARRCGLASRLLARAETEAAARGAVAAFVYAWLPAGLPEPTSTRFYARAGYRAGKDLAGFYAAGSVVSGARCPYCGAPPCRCAARPYVKFLPTG